MLKKQLYVIIPKMRLTEFFDRNGKSITSNADNMPFISTPDGLPSNISNLFMLKEYERGLASSTLRQYAANISHLIRFGFERGIDFIELNDDTFTQFISELRNEVDPKNPCAKKRDSNTLISIGRTSLDFLSFIGEFNDDPTFISKSIRAERKSVKIKVESSNRGFYETEFWSHHSFDTPDSRRKRSPISKDAIRELYDAIPIASDSTFLYRRRTAVLRVLEMTGARIGEVALIKVEDVEKALSMKNPMLRMTTLKKRSISERYVPVLRQDLVDLKSYLKIYRARIIKKKIGNPYDHGFVFINENTGKALSARYMSNEVGLLRRTANIDIQACAHMFRHRFITKLFVALMSQYKLENPDEFRRALLDVNVLKQQVQQYTGHSDLKSLDRYIDLAFKEVTNFEKVVNNVSQRVAYDSFDDHLDRLNAELVAGMSVAEYIEKLDLLKRLREEDIERFSEA